MQQSICLVPSSYLVRGLEYRSASSGRWQALVQYMCYLLMMHLTLERLTYDAFAEDLLQICPTPFEHRNDT